MSGLSCLRINDYNNQIEKPQNWSIITLNMELDTLMQTRASRFIIEQKPSIEQQGVKDFSVLKEDF
jgi:hypothetical protein